MPLKPQKTTEKDGISYFRSTFDESREMTQDARALSETCQDYYDGKQLTPEERQVLRKRKQPETIDNRVRIAINGVLGVIATGKSEPRAWPRTPKDEDAADVVTDILRFVSDENNFDASKLQCFRDMLVPGTMGAIVEVDDDLKPTITQIRWEEFFYDPRSRRNDLADARYKGIAKWRYVEDVAREYPDKAEEVRNYMNGDMAVMDETFEDRPRSQPWMDRRHGRILVVEMYHREKEWRRVVFCGACELYNEASPYLDAKGRPECPIEGQSAYVDRDNNRYGIVTDMIPMQDEINKREQLEAEFEKLAGAMKKDAMYES